MKTSTILTTMLAGAAVCALSTAPALAGAPNIHVAIAKGGIATLRSLGMKTNIPALKGHNASTVTISTFIGSFSASISETGFLGNPVQLWGDTWYGTTGGVCVQPKKEKYKGKGTKRISKVKGGVEQSTDFCTGTGTWNYVGPEYTLKSATATSDNITGAVRAKKFVCCGGTTYNLIGNTATHINIGHP